MARRALNKVTCGVEVIVRKSMPAKGSAGGVSTIFSERSILRIEFFSILVVTESAPTSPITKRLHNMAMRILPTMKASKPARKVFEKFIFQLFFSVFIPNRFGHCDFPTNKYTQRDRKFSKIAETIHSDPSETSSRPPLSTTVPPAPFREETAVPAGRSFRPARRSFHRARRRRNRRRSTSACSCAMPDVRSRIAGGVPPPLRA